MVIDPAVRSIRVAKALTDRFAELVRGPRTFDAGFGGTSLSALELRIGEAQQLYPEIWGHLDDARTVLAGRGVDLGAFEQIRATEPRGSIGVTRVDVESYSTTLTSQALGWADEQIKTANFNVAGLQRAIAAAQALMAAMPEVDWAGLARDEAAVLHAAGSLGPINARSLTRWIAIAGGAIAITYGIWYVRMRPSHRDPPPAVEEARVADQATVGELMHELNAHPCTSITILRTLRRQGGPVPSARELDRRCKAYLDDRTQKLDQDPCNATLLHEVIMASQFFGASMATTASEHYRVACAKAGGR